MLRIVTMKRIEYRRSSHPSESTALARIPTISKCYYTTCTTGTNSKPPPRSGKNSIFESNNRINHKTEDHVLVDNTARSALGVQYQRQRQVLPARFVTRRVESLPRALAIVGQRNYCHISFLACSHPQNQE